MNATNPVQKKVVSRTVVALGTVCIVLAVCLIGAISIYNSNISVKDFMIEVLNTNVREKDAQIFSLNNQKTSLENQIVDLNHITHLQESEIWVESETISQPANSYWSFSTSNATYAGYVVVWVQTSTTTNTYVRVIYSCSVSTRIVDSHVYVTEFNYDNQIAVGSGGTIVFPVLPCTNIEIRVGNTNLINGATETVTITYFY